MYALPNEILNSETGPCDRNESSDCGWGKKTAWEGAEGMEMYHILPEFIQLTEFCN